MLARTVTWSVWPRSQTDSCFCSNNGNQLSQHGTNVHQLHNTRADVISLRCVYDLRGNVLHVAQEANATCRPLVDGYARTVGDNLGDQWSPRVTQCVKELTTCRKAGACAADRRRRRWLGRRAACGWGRVWCATVNCCSTQRRQSSRRGVPSLCTHQCTKPARCASLTKHRDNSN